MEIVKRRFRKVCQLLESKKGAGMFTPVVALLVFLLFLVVLSDFIYLYSMVIGISDYTQEAVIQTAASNAYNVYDGSREGNSSAHLYAGNGVWRELVSTSEITERLEDMLGTTSSGNSLYQYRADGSLKYAISNIQVHCTNVEVGTGGNSVSLTFKTTVTAEIPVTFLGVTLHVKKPISLKSYYTPRF